MPDDRAKDLISRYERLLSDRGVWHTHWDDLARVMLPRRLGFATETTEGEKRTEELYDAVGVLGARGLANAIGGMLRPEGQPWFFIRTEEGEETDEEREWLAAAEERLREAFDNPRSRFRQATGEADLDLVVFGTAAMFVGETERRDSLLFQAVHLRDAVPFFDGEGNAVGMFRARRLPLREVEARFGRDAMSDELREKLNDERNRDEKVSLLHAVTPREDGRPGAMVARRLPWAGLWLERDNAHVLSEGGFHEFPFVVPRWDTSSGEDYGRSPGMIALPDTNTLQAMEETLLIAGQRSADPPLGVPSDGVYGEENTFPGGLVHYDPTVIELTRGNPIFPLPTGSNMPLTLEIQDRKREHVFMAYFRNVLNLPIQGPEMTATEVIQRKEEFIREIGPVFGRLEADYTASMVERAFMILLRARRFLPVPRSLAGRNVRFEYESPVKKVRQQTEAAAARMWAEEMMLLGQADPGAIDLINVDALGRFSAKALGLPHEIVRGREEVAERRQARAEAQQAQQQLATLREGVETADVAASAVQKAGVTNEQGGG